MSTQQAQTSAPLDPERTVEFTDLKSILTRLFFYWPLFVLGLAICIAAAFIYLKIAKPDYEIKAALIIKDDKKSPNQQQSAFQEIDMINSQKTIENEMEVLKSKQLIGQVIQDLQLWVTYKTKKGFVSEDLYSSSPVKLVLLEPSGNYKQSIINIIVKNNKSFYVAVPGGDSKEFKFNETISNSFGKWKLEPTENVSQYKGTTIELQLNDPEILALQYQRAVDISLADKLATTVILTIDDDNIQRGKDILNRLIANYNLTMLAEKNRQTKLTLDFLDQRIALLSNELSQAEGGIERFKSNRGITDISSDSKVNLENQQANETRLNEVNVQLRVVEGIEKYINSAQNASNVPATVGISDPALSSLIEKFSQLQLQHDRLAATTPETNPDFESINRQIATTRSAIKENVNNIKLSLLNSKNELQSFNSHFESSIKSIPTQERQYNSIKRLQSSKETLYTYLLQKREEVALSFESTLTDDRIVDQAYFNAQKGPKKQLALAIALILGLSLPAGFIYGKNSFNNKVMSLSDIRSSVKIPVIGELTFEKSSNPIVVSDNSTNEFNEQFRALRTKLLYLNYEEGHGRVTLLTSSVLGEGKSFVSSNLAIAMAFAGRKTVIIEMDFHEPKLAQIFKLSKDHKGVNDFLKNNSELEEIIQNSGLASNLDVISSGLIVPNPSDLLEKKQLKTLLSILRIHYDEIIINSPAVHVVPDAMIISRLTDLTLYIIRQGFTEKKELGFLNELFYQKQLTNIHLILNGVDKNKYGYG